MQTKLNIIGRSVWRLKVIGAWPKRSYWPLFLVPTSILLIAELGRFFHLLGGVNVIIGIFSNMKALSGVVAVEAKTFLMYRFSHKVHEIYDLVQRGMETSGECISIKTEKHVHRRYKFTNKLCTVLAFLSSVLVYGYMVFAYATLFLDSHENRTFIVAVSPESVWIKSDIGYSILLISFTLHSYIVNNGIIAFDTTYIASCHYISSKSIILADMLEGIGVRLRDRALQVTENYDDVLSSLKHERKKKEGFASMQNDMLTWSTNKEDEESVFAEIIHCVKYHQNICRLRDIVEELCSSVLFLVIVSLVLFLGLPFLEVMLVGLKTHSQLYMLTFLLFFYYGQLVYFCSWGGQVHVKSQMVSDAAYSVYTSGFCSQRIKFALQMMILKGQRPLYLTASSFFTITNETFIDIASRTYSICTFALSIR